MWLGTTTRNSRLRWNIFNQFNLTQISVYRGGLPGGSTSKGNLVGCEEEVGRCTSLGHVNKEGYSFGPTYLPPPGQNVGYPRPSCFLELILLGRYVP
jgi:hypothetical protein